MEMEKTPLVLRRVSLATAGLFVALLSPVAFAQRGSGDWMTNGFDAQRSYWVRNDEKISKASMSKPGFGLLWKVKPANMARQLNTLTPPSLLDFYISYRGFRTLGFFGGSDDRVIAYDLHLSRVEWEKSYAAKSNRMAGTVACPGGLTANVTRPTVLAYRPVPTGSGPGRGTPAKSGVGAPYEGAVTIRRDVPRPAPPPPVAAAKPAAPAAPSPFSPRIQWVNALTGDGRLHSLYVSNGEEPAPALPFLPVGANAHGLVVVDRFAYVATQNSCSGVDNGVWALDMDGKSVNKWKASANVAGTAGPAIAPDGTVYVTAGAELAALEAKTLAPKGSYKSAAGEFTSSPVVFEFKGKNLVAATSAQGHLQVVDTADLSKPFAQSAVFATPGYQAGGLASWQDPSGTRWILAPSGKNITAFKLGGEGKLEVAWTSRELVTPMTPVVINGVVFALSSGEFRSDSVKTTVAKSVPAVLYALDSATGKELWNSGATMTSFVHSGGLSAGDSRVYVGTYEGTQYVFSFPFEI
jgi:outer membrane protein assembly factor BamB